MKRKEYARDIKIQLNKDCDDSKFLDDFIDMIEKNDSFLFSFVKDHNLEGIIEVGSFPKTVRRFWNVFHWLKKHPDVIEFEFGKWFDVNEK